MPRYTEMSRNQCRLEDGRIVRYDAMAESLEAGQNGLNMDVFEPLGAGVVYSILEKSNKV